MMEQNLNRQEFISLKHINLPKPLPQSYLGKRNFLLRHRNELDLVEFGKDGRGKRYFLKQEDVNNFVKRKFNK